MSGKVENLVEDDEVSEIEFDREEGKTEEAIEYSQRKQEERVQKHNLIKVVLPQNAWASKNCVEMSKMSKQTSIVF